MVAIGMPSLNLGVLNKGIFISNVDMLLYNLCTHMSCRYTAVNARTNNYLTLAVCVGIVSGTTRIEQPSVVVIQTSDSKFMQSPHIPVKVSQPPDCPYTNSLYTAHMAHTEVNGVIIINAWNGARRLRGLQRPTHSNLFDDRSKR